MSEDKKLTTDDIFQILKNHVESGDDASVMLKIGDEDITLYPEIIDDTTVNLCLDAEMKGEYLEVFI